MSLTLRDLRRTAVIAAAYYAAARLGLLAAVAQHVVSSAWPPAGIALAVVLLLGVRMWPGVALGAFLVNATNGVPFTWALAMAAGNALEAVLGALLLTRAGFRRDMVRLADVLLLVLFGAAVAPVVAATIGVASLAGAGQVAAGTASRLWLVYWSGDAIGVLLFAPLVLGWGARVGPAWSPGRVLEALGIGAVLVALTGELFRSPLGYNYIVFPVVCWAAIRFGVRGGSAAAVVVAVLAVWFTAEGTGPFANTGRTPTENLYLLQTYIGLMAATALVLASAVSERSDAERRARQSERALQDAQALARLGSWSWDSRRNVLTCSPELCRIFGLQAPDAPGTYAAFLDRVHPDDRGDVRAALARSLETGEPFRFEQRVMRPGGEVRVVDHVGEAVRGPAGQVTMLRGIAYDITERKTAEEELKRSEQRFRLFLESVRDYVIIMLDPDGRVTSWNSGAERVCGWTAEEIIGKPHREFYTEEDRILGRPEANLRIASRFGWVEEEGWRIKKGGLRYWADVTIASVRDASGVLLGFAKVTRDLTERRRAEEALKDREQLLEAMFDRTASGIALLDRAGRFVRVNRRFEQLLGYSARELSGSSLDALIDPADRVLGRDNLADMLESRRESVQAEARMRRKDGQALWVLSTMAVIPGPDGLPRNFITIVEDISAQRRVQEELHANREELRALSQKLLGVQEAERTRLARELHDQIGQALSAVLMSLENLSRPGDTERRSAAPIQDSKRIVEQAIEQVRTLSFDLRPSMLDDLGLAAAAAAYCKRQAKLAGIELALDIEPLSESPPKEVEVAAYRILQEAVTNTLRHAGASRVGLRLCGDARTLELVIEDDGRGFDPERLKHESPGQHLGLVGMRERAEQAGGNVSVNSWPGKGTEVRAYFHFEEDAS